MLKSIKPILGVSEPLSPVPDDAPALAQALLSWYHTVKRDLPWRQTHDPYAIWVSEVMLQQTQVKTVIPYYLRFLERFPSLNILAQVELEEVLSYWRGLGYYARARHLWEGARHVFFRLNAEIPKTYEALRQIPGIGEYTAGAIASIAFGVRIPAIDGNVRRILSRILAWPHPIGSALSRREFQNRLLEWMPTSQTEGFGQTPGDFNNAPGNFNQALMELGATVCLPKSPCCSACPVSAWCQASAPELYPVKRAKNKPSSIIRLTFVLIREDQIYLQKRPSKGLLADLLEFPGCELPLQEVSMNRAHQNFLLPALTGTLLPLTPDDCFSLYQKAVIDRSYDREAWELFQSSPALHGPARHTFSHRHWELYWLILPIKGHVFPNLIREAQNPPENSRWLSFQELDSAPIPTAFQKVIDAAKIFFPKLNLAAGKRTDV
ncbi:A/G-specific adenine glycosylase [Paradesulfitobacterium aromaticivorans]